MSMYEACILLFLVLQDGSVPVTLIFCFISTSCKTYFLKYGIFIAYIYIYYCDNIVGAIITMYMCSVPIMILIVER